MKRLSFFLFLFFLWMTVRAQMLRSSGLVLYGGKNTVNYQVASPEKGLPPFDLANSRLGADFTLGAGYRWRLNRPDTGWFFDLSLSQDMAATAMDSVIFLLTCIRRMWAEKESVICGRHLLLEVWDGTCFED